MKKILILLCVVFVLTAGGCTVEFPEINAPSDYEYEYRTTLQTAESQETTLPAVPQESTSASAGEETQSTDIQEPVSVTNDVPEATTSGTPSSSQPRPSQESTTIPPEMDLSISMPDKNGTMVTDKSSSNKFIRIISENRGINSSYLVAVYAVPESGQNYVFEFSSKTGRTEDDLRRVYLINEKGAVTGVAAANGSEKEYLSSTENWFCMNVLIKGLIFPAIEKDLKA